MGERLQGLNATYLDLVCRPYSDAMNRKILFAVLGIGAGFSAIGSQAGAEERSKIPLEKRGMILGTMAHLKSVKLQDAPVIPAYVVNNDNVLRADPETAKFIAGLLSNCILNFWDQ